MDDAAARRSIDDFLINPTVPIDAPMDEYSSYRESRCENRNSMLLDSPNLLLIGKPEKLPSSSHASIRSLDDEHPYLHDYASDEEIASQIQNEERPYLHNYTSDEEVASPIENDDYTFDSTSSCGEDDESVASIHEAQSYHAQTHNNAQQLCSQAQAVKVLSVGRPRVVSMSKSVEAGAPHTPSESTSEHEAEFRLPVPRLSPTQASRYTPQSSAPSPRSSGENLFHRSMPGPGSAPATGLSVRRKPNLRVETMPRPQSTYSVKSGRTPQTAWPLQRPSFLDHDPYGADSMATSSPQPSTPRRRLFRLSPPLSTLKSLSRSLRRGSTSDGSLTERAINKRDIGYPIASPATPDTPVPTRTSSKPMPKMVARGANERAAAIEIPPCPADYEDGLRASAWPSRSDSVGNMDDSTPSQARVRGDRRKSLSALASTQI